MSQELGRTQRLKKSAGTLRTPVTRGLGFVSIALTLLLLLGGGLEAAHLLAKSHTSARSLSATDTSSTGMSTDPKGNSGTAPITAASGSNPMAFGAADCTAAPGSGAATEPLADNFRVVARIPTGWTREPLGASETQMLVIDAPPNYTHPSTRIELLSLIGYFPNQAPRDIAPMYFAPSVHPDVPSDKAVGSVTDCQVQGDRAAFVQYVRGDRGGYLVLFLHDNYLYGVRVEGSAGVDPMAVRDAKQLLGSIQWTVTTPPAR